MSEKLMGQLLFYVNFGFLWLKNKEVNHPYRND